MDRTGPESTPLIPRLVILLKVARGYHLVDVRTIMHVQADARFSRITFSDGSEKAVFHTISELEAILGCGMRTGDLLFIRTHRAHLAAFHHATGVKDKRILLLAPNGASRVPISRDRWRAVEHAASSALPANPTVHAGLMPIMGRSALIRPKRERGR